jgi:UDP-N-acetylmuramoylalanine--D-glutamate ligase
LGFRLQRPLNNEFGIHQNETGTYLAYGDQLLLPLKNVPLRGQHQIANVLAALALGTVIGLPMEAMLQAVQTFQGLPHRCQWVANIDEVDWYNDSKATNVGATLAAILGLGVEIKGKIVLLAGGQGKNADFKELYSPIKKYGRTVIIYGQDRNLLNKDLQGAAPIVNVNNFEEAILQAKQHAQPGDVVLLAPACASFDMFRNYEHRGEVFMEIVRGLKK